MKLEDVSDASHSDRVIHYAENLGVFKEPDFAIRAALMQSARDAASEEMLDEIHTMLRALLERTNG